MMARRRKVTQVISSVRLLSKSRLIADEWHKADALYEAAGALIPDDNQHGAVPPERPTTKPKRRRKPGGGTKKSLTDAEIAKLQKVYRRELKKTPRLRNQEAAVEDARRCQRQNAV